MRTIVVIIAATAALAAVGPAAAHEDHASWAGFGEFVSGFARQGAVGGLVRDIAATGPKAVGEATAGEHALYCAPWAAGKERTAGPGTGR